MKKNTEFYRKVVSVTERNEEHTAVRGRNFSWRVDRVQIAVAECGHTRTYRGWSATVPKVFSPCKECVCNS